MKIRSKRALSLLFASLLVIGISITANQILGKLFYINLSASMPRGIYRISSGEIKKGDTVIFSVPQGYQELDFLKNRKNLIKEVYGVAGDRYCITEKGISLNNKFIASRLKGFKKKIGCFQVAPDHILPLALYKPDSFDGRYFGEVKAIKVRKFKIIDNLQNNFVVTNKSDDFHLKLKRI